MVDRSAGQAARDDSRRQPTKRSVAVRVRPPGNWPSSNNYRIDEVLTHRRRQLEAQLERIAGRAAGNSASGDPQTYGQPKLRILPRYRSKKDPTVTWSGRGMLPKWMREEMKGTKLTKDDFLISR
jgi:hypothetical protein